MSIRWFSAMVAGTLVTALPAPAGAAAGAGKAIVVVLHGVSWEELAAADVPALQALLRRAAVGVMNSRVLGAQGWADPYITIGAGRGAVAHGQFRLFALPSGPSARKPDAAQDMAALRDANRIAHTQAEPGLLGTFLHEHGLRTGLLAVCGVGRAGPKSATLSVAIAMDATGMVDQVEYEVLEYEPPTLAPMLRRSHLLLVDLKELEDRPGGAPAPPQPDPEALSALRRQVPLFRQLERQIDPARDLLIIISPTCPPYHSPKQMSYAPIAIIGPGFGPGLLTSASTRRAGIVANVDIAPTILRYFGIYGPGGRTHRTVGTEILRSAPRLRSSPPLGMTYSGQLSASMSGHPIIARRARQPLKQILAISRRGVRLFDLQWRFGPVYALSQFFVFMGVGAALLFAPAWVRRSRRRLRLVLLLGMAVPLALFLLGPLDPGGVVSPYLVLAALAAALTWFAFTGSAPLTALGALLTATAGVTAIDAMTGGHLLNDFMMNFGAMYGSRFYGIGNEAMGAIVACSAVGGAALVQQSGKTRASLWALGLWFALIALVIGAPFWGANFGGGITAAFGFAVAYLGIRSRRPRLRHWAAAIAPAAAMAILVIALDLLGNVRTWSHVGDSARLVSAGGVPAALDIAARKAQGSLRVMTLVPWLGITLAVCAVATWLVLKPPGRLGAALELNPILWAGLAAGTAGAVAAVIVNDSGVVAASSAVGITALAIAYAALGANGAPQ